MRFGTFLVTAVAVAGLALPAAAQETYAIGTNKQGSLAYSTGTAIAKLLSDKSDIQIRVQPGAGSSTVVPQMNAGKIDFGLNNAAESRFAHFGTNTFEGRPNPNLMLVAKVYPLYMAIAVPNDSQIKAIEDARGKRMGFRFTSQTILQYTQDAMLASAGLKQSDMENYPYPGYVAAQLDMARGKLDIAEVGPGSSASKQTNAMLRSSGGLRLLSLGDDTKAMQAVFPEAYPVALEPTKKIPSIRSKTTVMAYPYFLTAGKHVPAEVVYTAVKLMHDNKKMLAATFGPFARFNPDDMAAKSKVPYHPGAVKFYKEIGQWK